MNNAAIIDILLELIFCCGISITGPPTCSLIIFRNIPIGFAQIRIGCLCVFTPDLFKLLLICVWSFVDPIKSPDKEKI